MAIVNLKKTVLVQVQASQVKTLTATLDDGTTVNVTGPITIGDWSIIDATGVASILSDADFQSEVVSA